MLARLGIPVAFLLVFAGCTSGESGTPAAPGFGDGSPDLDGDTGSLLGTVLDGEQIPVPGTAVTLLPGSYSTESAEDGTFTLSGIAPGEYTLHAIKLGYEANARRVTIVAGEQAEATILLEPLPVSEPRIEVFGPFQGYMQCRMATILSSGACGFLPLVGSTPVTSIWTNDKVLWDFGKFSGEDWEALVFESQWTPSTAATNPKMNQIFSHQNRTGTQWWSDSGGRESPINFVYSKEEGGPGGQDGGAAPKDKKPGMDHMLRTWITLPFGTATTPVEVAYELRFQMMVTIFYSEGAPEQYSAFPDA